MDQIEEYSIISNTVNPLINPHGGLFFESILGWGFIRGGGLLEGGAYS